MNTKINFRKNFDFIFILPYLCGLYFLFLYSKTMDFSNLYCFLLIFIYSTFCHLLTFRFSLKLKHLYSTKQCEFIESSKKTVKLMTAFFVFSIAVLLISNFVLSIINANQTITFCIALIFSSFPQSLFFLSKFCISSLASNLMSLGIKQKNPNAFQLFNESKIIVIDEFDLFSNPDLIFELSANQNIILVSKKSENEIKSIFNKYIFNAKILSSKNGELPAFSKDTSIFVYPSSSIGQVVSILKNLNIAFCVVSPNETIGLHLKISSNINSDFDMYIPENNISLLVAIQKNCIRAFNSYRKCFIYISALNAAKLIFSFVCLLLCSDFPLMPLFIIIFSVICELLPPASFIPDKSDKFLQRKISSADDLMHILLDGSLIAIVVLIVFMLASIGYSKNCAKLISFNTFVISSLFYALNMRSEKSIFLIGILTNKLTNIAFFSGISLSVIITGVLYDNISSFSASAWLLTISMSVLPFVIMQLQKATTSFFRK